MKLMRVRYGALGRHVCGSKGVMLIMAYRNRRSCSAVMDKCSQPEQHNIIHMIASISTHTTVPRALRITITKSRSRPGRRSLQGAGGGYRTLVRTYLVSSEVLPLARFWPLPGSRCGTAHTLTPRPPSARRARPIPQPSTELQTSVQKAYCLRSIHGSI